MELEITGKRKKGPPRKSREECIKNDLERYVLGSEGVYNQDSGKSKLKLKLLIPACWDNGIKTATVVVPCFTVSFLKFFLLNK